MVKKTLFLDELDYKEHFGTSFLMAKDSDCWF